MTTTYTSPLVALVHGMQAYQGSRKLPFVVGAAGWKQRAQQLNQAPTTGANRVLVIPGDIPTSPGQLTDGGELVRGKITGFDPRPLFQWNQLATVSVWAVAGPPFDQTNEEKNIEALTNLLEWTMQAIHHAVDPDTETPVGLANIETPIRARWTPNTECKYGLEVLLSLSIKTPLYDYSYDLTTTAQPAVHRDPIAP